MRTIKKQSGFAEISMIGFLALLVVAAYVYIQYIAIKKEEREADVTGNTINLIVSSAMSYYQDNIGWPDSIDKLIPKYMADTTSARLTPWGKPYQISITSSNLLQISVDAKTAKMAGRISSMIPLASVSGTTVTAKYGKPGSEPALDVFLKKDGSTPLTGEWDVGNFGISNIKDMTINGLDNRTVLSGLTYSTVLQNDQAPSLITCPARATRKISVVPLFYSKNGYPFNKIGAVEGRFENGKAFVRVWETDTSGNQGWFIPAAASASVLVQQQCAK